MNIKVFNFSTVAVRMVMIAGDPWFVAKDVAETLGYSNTRDAIQKHCRRVDDVAICDAIGREQMTNIIPESDVYRLIFRSKLPAAQKFEDWVVEEVLPSIRKTGKYEIPQPTDDYVLRSVAAIADYLGRSPQSVYEQIRRGELPAVMERHAWTIRKADLQSWYDRSVRHAMIAPVAPVKSVLRWDGIDRPANVVIDRTPEFIDWLGKFEYSIDARLSTKQFLKLFNSKFTDWQPAIATLYRTVTSVTGAPKKRLRINGDAVYGFNLRCRPITDDILAHSVVADIPKLPPHARKEISEVLKRNQ